MIKELERIEQNKSGSQLLNIYTGTNFNFSRIKSDFEKCLDDCLIQAVLGDNPFNPIEGEAKAFAYSKVGDIALKKAKKIGLKTVTVKLGAYAVPGLSLLSTAISVKKFYSCALNCDSKYKCPYN